MQSANSDVNPYLQQEVLSASPPRLRWMLIRRSEELCRLVQQLWAAGNEREGSDWMIRIREILGELIEGVQDKTNPVGEQISDFYVFLLKLFSEAERDLDISKLETLRSLLEIEAETWDQVARRFSDETQSNSSTSTDLFVGSGEDFHIASANPIASPLESQAQAGAALPPTSPAAATASPAAIPPALPQADFGGLESSFSLEV